MAKQNVVAKSWATGTQPTRKGTYIVADADRTNPRFVTAVECGTTIRVFDMKGDPVEQNEAMFHYGPIPGIERSIAAVQRHLNEAAAEPVQS